MHLFCCRTHFIFVCKPPSHPLIQEYITGVGLQTHEETVKRGKNKIVHRYRWIHPLHDGKDALKVNWFEIEILNAHGELTITTALSPILRLAPTMSPNWPHAAALVGKLRMSRSMY
jgi:hypothetical protein